MLQMLCFSLFSFLSAVLVLTLRYQYGSGVECDGWGRYCFVFLHGCVGRLHDAHTPYTFVFWVYVLCYCFLYCGMRQLDATILWVRGLIRCTCAILMGTWLLWVFGRWDDALTSYYLSLHTMLCLWSIIFCDAQMPSSDFAGSAVNYILWCTDAISCIIFYNGCLVKHDAHTPSVFWYRYNDFWYGSIISCVVLRGRLLELRIFDWAPYALSLSFFYFRPYLYVRAWWVDAI
jgi:hypothetical protein